MFRMLTISVMCPTHKEVMVKVHVVDLKSENIAAPISVRAYLNQTITEFKQLISQVLFCSRRFFAFTCSWCKVPKAF